MFLSLLASSSARAEDELPAELARPAHAITVADIYRQSVAIRQIMDQLSFVMGKKRMLHPRLIVENAQPWDVWFQAVAIYNKTSLFAFQYTRQTYPEISSIDANQANLENIWNILHQTLIILYRLQPVLDVRKAITIDMPKSPLTLTDVSKLLIEFNQRINDMGWVQVSPAETYGELTKAIYLAAALLADSPEPQEIPDAPAFERGNTPNQVYRRLLDIMDIINRISERQRIPSIKIRVEDLTTDNIHPSDVNDMTYFIIARLQAFYYLKYQKNKEIEAYYHGWKFPSHIFQRAGILQRQVQHLYNTVVMHPSWLQGTVTHAETP